MENKEIISFQLIGLDISEFAILDQECKDVTQVKINTGLQFGINDIDNLIVCHVIIELLSENGEKLLKLKTDNHFKVKEADWNNFRNEKVVTLPKGFLAHLATISTGSARGIFHCKSENTVFNQITLPLLNVAAMLPEDEVIDLK